MSKHMKYPVNKGCVAPRGCRDLTGDTAPAVSARPDGGRDGRRPYEKPELINLTDIDDQFLMDTP